MNPPTDDEINDLRSWAWAEIHVEKRHWIAEIVTKLLATYEETRRDVQVLTAHCTDMENSLANVAIKLQQMKAMYESS